MFFKPEHDLHKRRRGRNMGLGLVLGVFVALVFDLTVVKVSNTDFSNVPGAAQSGGTE